MSAPRTLYDKIWDAHVVDRQDDGTCLLYIDRHLVHEVTSPQAFEGLRMAGRKVRRPTRRSPWPTTTCRPRRTASSGIKDEESRASRSRRWRKNAAEFGVEYYSDDTTSARASSTSSARSRASRCPA